MICQSIRQISRILQVIGARTGLIARDLLAKLQHPIGLGRGQVVRHRFLVSCIVGSNPTAPAIFSYKTLYKIAHNTPHLPQARAIQS